MAKKYYYTFKKEKRGRKEISTFDIVYTIVLN
jgi:hypothetical protein